MEYSPNISHINKNLTKIATDVTALDMLLTFDKVLEDAGIYAYANWLDGELVDGPHVSRYWFETTWMWPEKLMPDPDAGLRLTEKGCKVYFYKDVFKEPKNITDESSYADRNSKKVKLAEHPVWCVKIKMPRQLIDDQVGDIVDLEKIVTVKNDRVDKSFEQDQNNDQEEQQ